MQSISVESVSHRDWPLATYWDLRITIHRLIECTIQLSRRNSSFAV